MNNDFYDFGPDGIAPCPFCEDKGPLVVMFADAKYVVVCSRDNCSGRGPIFLSREAAIEAWNAPARRELALQWALEVQEAWLTVHFLMPYRAYKELRATYVKAMKDVGMEVGNE